MSGILFDSYSFAQSNASPAAGPDPSWGPSSTRFITGSGGSSVDVTGGQLVINFDGVNNGIIDYNYTAIENLSGVTSISLDVISAPIVTNVGLRLFDLMGFQTIFVTESGGTLTWLMSSFNTVNLAQITAIEIRFTNSNTEPGTYTFDNLNSLPILCLAANTHILMSNGTEQSIKTIKRGDLVASDPNFTRTNRVSKVNLTSLKPNDYIDIVEFEIESLGNKSPNRQLITTVNHPIIYKNTRKPAYCFYRLPGIKEHKKINLKDFMARSEKTESCDLYDLQFDYDGTYVANGVTVQSRCPRSEYTPLPKELYFDQTLYTDETTWDSYDHELPFDNKIIDPEIQ
jgi:hypothetical protein